jgi:hypothetical protein
MNRLFVYGALCCYNFLVLVWHSFISLHDLRVQFVVDWCKLQRLYLQLFVAESNPILSWMHLKCSLCLISTFLIFNYDDSFTSLFVPVSLIFVADEFGWLFQTLFYDLIFKKSIHSKLFRQLNRADKIILMESWSNSMFYVNINEQNKMDRSKAWITMFRNKLYFIRSNRTRDTKSLSKSTSPRTYK